MWKVNLERILEMLKSVKLAVALILYLAAASVLATLVPQGREAAFYDRAYSPLLSSLIMSTGFHRFFRSATFLVPLLLFSINLLACTVDRLFRELTGKTRKNFGIDLVHTGLIVLIAGGIVTYSARRSGFRYLAAGDQIGLPGRLLLTLEEFEFVRYPDGRPKDWISVVDVERDGERVVDSRPIEVNKPLRIGRLRIYQASHAREVRLVVRDSGGNEFAVAPGDLLRTGGFTFRYRNAERIREEDGGYRLIFEKWDGNRLVESLVVPSPGRLGNVTIEAAAPVDVTGLRFVEDPGYLPVLIALALIMVGLSITSIKKIRDMSS